MREVISISLAAIGVFFLVLFSGKILSSIVMVEEIEKGDHGGLALGAMFLYLGLAI